MLDKFEDYLGSLPLTKVIKDRINECLHLNFEIHQEEFVDIFISDIKDKEGSRTFNSLWIFTDKLAIECKNFLLEYDFDATPYCKATIYGSMKFQEYDLKKATENSSIAISVIFENTGAGNFVATGSNCAKAYDIYKKHFLANLSPSR